jgi:hypothetical protein
LTPSYQHERLKSLLTTLFEAMAIGLDPDFENAGSTTFKREDASRVDSTYSGLGSVSEDG